MSTYFTAVARMLTSATLLAFAACAAAQQAYPSKPIRIITAYAPGGSMTVLARLIGEKLTESWGQQVLVDNRPGGNTVIGTEALQKSPPDGYTIMLVGSSHVLIPLFIKVPYDPIRDFTPVATLGSTEYVLLLHPSVPAKTLQELIAYAKSRPGQLNYATPAAGTSQHLAHEVLNLLAGIKTQHIPYKGSNPALTDLLGGHVQMYFSTTVTAIPHVNSGKVRAVAITGQKRLPNLPQVPTFEEAGLSWRYKVGGYYGIIAPNGTPKPIVNKLSAEVARYLALPDLQEKLVGHGLTPYSATPEHYAALLQECLDSNAKIIRTANITFEQ